MIDMKISEIFCDDNMPQVRSVINLLMQFYPKSIKEILCARYSEMRDAYKSGVCAQDKEALKYPGVKYVDKHSNYRKDDAVLISKDYFSGSSLAFVSKYRECGVDLPIWFSPNGKIKHRIMIVGQDPYRSDKVQWHKYIMVASPWGMHVQNNRRNGALRQLIEELVFKHSCQVYLTDYVKLYFQDDEKKLKFKKREEIIEKFVNNPKIHEDLLKSEIEIIKPDVILFLGGWVCETSLGIEFNPYCKRYCRQFDASIITVYHPNVRQVPTVKSVFNCLGAKTLDEYYKKLVLPVI